MSGLLPQLVPILDADFNPVSADVNGWHWETHAGSGLVIGTADQGERVLTCHVQGQLDTGIEALIVWECVGHRIEATPLYAARGSSTDRFLTTLNAMLNYQMLKRPG